VLSTASASFDLAAPGRLAGAGPVAVIDIGSNSVRLVLYERLARSPTPLFNEKVLAGLGAGVAETGRLADAAIAETLAALRRFRLIIRQTGASDVTILATAATREAENGASFIAMVERVCGVAVTVLSGEDEARISAYGIVSGIHGPDGVAGDLGGGSLELTEVRDAEVGPGESLKLGGLRLRADAKGSLNQAAKIAKKTLESSSVAKLMRGRDFYAVGGSWRSLAKLHMRQSGYPLRVMHNYVVEADEMADFLRPLRTGVASAASGIEVVARARQPLLPYGAIVLSEVLRRGKPRRVVISALGLREGHLYARLDTAMRAEDPLIAAARELATLRSRSPRHAEELIAFSGETLQALGIPETEDEARLRAAACLLSDIGWRAHPDDRGEQSLHAIAQGAFVGVDHPGRAYIALAVYHRYAGLGDERFGRAIRELAPMRYLERARAVAASLRLAFVLSAASPGVIDRIHLRRQAKRLVLVLPQSLGALAGSRVESRLAQLGALGNLTPDIRVEP